MKVASQSTLGGRSQVYLWNRPRLQNREKFFALCASADCMAQGRFQG